MTISIDDAERRSLLTHLVAETPTMPMRWRHLQLLRLIERLPLPEGATVCSRCEGDGGKNEPAACPGDCCHVCPACMGRRWFAPEELVKQVSVEQRFGETGQGALEIWTQDPEGLIDPTVCNRTLGTISLPITRQDITYLLGFIATRSESPDAPVLRGLAQRLHQSFWWPLR